MFFPFLIFFTLAILFFWTLGKIAQWCRRIAKVLEDNKRSENSKKYFEEAVAEERRRKEKIKNEVLSSKYLTPEYLVDRRETIPTDRQNSEDQVKVEQLIRDLDDT